MWKKEIKTFVEDNPKLLDDTVNAWLGRRNVTIVTIKPFVYKKQLAAMVVYVA